jgi:hypothetical protein
MELTVGLSGVARSGKDSFFSLAKKYFSEYNISCERLALADNLKHDLKQFVMNKFGIDIFNMTADEKELIRDLMVSYGKIKRKQTNGKYWTHLLEDQIDLLKDKANIIFITDIRYAIYQEDEIHWLKNKHRGLLIHVSRLKEDNEVLPPANEEEKFNDPILKSCADLKLLWRTSEDVSCRRKECEDILREIKQEYERRRRKTSKTDTNQ